MYMYYLSTSNSTKILKCIIFKYDDAKRWYCGQQFQSFALFPSPDIILSDTWNIYQNMQHPPQIPPLYSVYF